MPAKTVEYHAIRTGWPRNSESFVRPSPPRTVLSSSSGIGWPGETFSDPLGMTAPRTASARTRFLMERALLGPP